MSNQSLISVEIKNLMQDNVWPYLIVDNEYLRGQLLETDLANAAIRNGKEAARLVRKRYPKQTAAEIAYALGVKVEQSRERAQIGWRHRRAIYQRYPPQILIFMEGVLQLSRLAVEFDLTELVSQDAIIEVIIAHELLHHLEPELMPNLKRQYRIKWLAIGSFTLYREIYALREIAAHTFSKEICELSISPAVLDLLTINNSKHRLSNLFKEVRKVQASMSSSKAS
jgi:hypothetical protein